MFPVAKERKVLPPFRGFRKADNAKEPTGNAMPTVGN